MQRREFLQSTLALGAVGLLPSVDLASGSTIHRAGDRLVLPIKEVEYPFRWCPPGTFMMGVSTSNLHQVTMTRGFWIQEMPVMQEQWGSVTENNSNRLRFSHHPMEGVSWDDCQDYVQKLNGLNVAPKGCRFSLPTEAQWEYAYRAEKTRGAFFHFANEWGTLYMYDNILRWEWCSDWYERYPSDNAIDPAGGLSDKTRVIRGRHGNGDDRRAGASPRLRSKGFGFRLALVCEG